MKRGRRAGQPGSRAVGRVCGGWRVWSKTQGEGREREGRSRGGDHGRLGTQKANERRLTHGRLTLGHPCPWPWPFPAARSSEWTVRAESSIQNTSIDRPQPPPTTHLWTWSMPPPFKPCYVGWCTFNACALSQASRQGRSECTTIALSNLPVLLFC